MSQTLTHTHASRIKLLITGFAVVWLLGAAPLVAQQGRGTLFGTVTDASGAAVPNVSITVTNTDTNLTFATTSNEEGFYTLPALQVGNYNVAVEQRGFKKLSRSGITLQVDQRAQVDLQLEVGDVSEMIEVTAETPLTDAGSATVGKVIENRRVTELPLNGRNALALTLLTPSVKSNAGPTNSGFADRGTQLSSISINGGPNAQNGNVLDGGNNIQTYVGEVSINPAVDAVEEFKVQSGAMSAEFGFTAGGVINLVTKAGTNNFNGTLYEFVRNDAFDARNAFLGPTQKKPVLRYNQFGGSIGGPVYLPRFGEGGPAVYSGRSRSFFFFNYEEFRFRRALPQLGTVPTLLQRQGNFSDVRDRNGNLIPIFDAFSTTGTGTGVVRTRFANNVIPQNRLDAVALAIQNYYPLPNRQPSSTAENPFAITNNYEGVANNLRSMRQYTVRIDHRFTESNSLTGRFSSYLHRTDGGGTAGALYPDPVLSLRDDVLQTRNIVLTDTHTFSPALINEFRLGVNRGSFPFTARSFGGNYPQLLGLPAVVPSDTFPQISGNGFPSFNTGTVGFRGSVAWQFFDMATLVRGNHSLKFGIDHRLQRGNNYQASSPSGNFSFGAALTGNGLPGAAATGTGIAYASFLLGAVASAAVTRHIGESQRNFTTSFFFQDDWKATRRLTLNLGVRYDYQQQPVEANNGASNFDPYTVDSNNGLLGRTIYAGVNGQPRSFRNPDRNDFAPRVGFALDVFGSGRTVLRGGYAIYYPSMFYRANFGGTAGYATTTTNYNPPGGDGTRPAFRLSNGFPSAPLLSLGNALGPSAFLGQNVSYDEPDGTTPMSQQWDLSLQQQLPGGFVVDFTYSGNKGSHFISGGYDLNQLDPQYLALGTALSVQVPNPYAGRVPGNFGTPTISRLQSLRPYPYMGNITVRSPHLGNFISHSGLLSVEKRFSPQGLTLLFSYTKAKLISDSIASPVDFGEIEQVNENGYQNGKFARNLERSLDPTDVSDRATVSALYELPFGRGKTFESGSGFVNNLIGGYQLSLIGIMQTGIPLIVRGATNGAANRPNSTGTSARLDDPTAERWFDTSQFVNPPPFTYGNVGRVLPDVRTPGTTNFDMSLIKNTRFGEDFNLQLRAEAFNVFNHVNLSAPTTTFGAGPDGRNNNANFGRITAARDPRQLQFGVKLIF